jgi:hypothetical protein
MLRAKKTSRIAAAIVAACAAAAPVASAMPAPDTADTGQGSAQSPAYVASPSPDAIDAATGTIVDRRSPDAADAARSAAASQTPAVTLNRTVVSQDSGFDWGDAGLGALAMLGIAGIGAGAVVAVGRHRRRTAHGPVATG